MSKKIVLYFPTNYRHGNLGDSYYREEISIFSVSPLTSDFINEIFKNTQLYKNLKIFSYDLYIQWDSVNNSKIIEDSNKESDIFVAVPKITVFYKGKNLRYFHVPTYNNVKFDFYLLTREKNDIMSKDNLIIEDKTLFGKYIISL